MCKTDKQARNYIISLPRDKNVQQKPRKLIIKKGINF